MSQFDAIPLKCSLSKETSSGWGRTGAWVNGENGCNLRSVMQAHLCSSTQMCLRALK